MTTCPIETTQKNTPINKAAELASISKKYPLAKSVNKSVSSNLQDFWALKDVSLDIMKGKVTGIIGRNGSGKTTLLNIIAGVLSPTQGTISVKGRVLGLFSLGIGFQDELSGRENIFLNGALLGASRKEIEDKLSSIIDFSELGDFIDMPLGSYSQGMRLRLAFSIIANLDFDVLVLDEVLAVGDTLFQNKCFERLMDFRRSQKTLIITTQSMDLIERLCDEAVLLDHGCLLFQGEPLECINRYRSVLNTERFFVGSSRKNIHLVENTKKWVDDISNFGRELGTKEVIIEKVDLINRFGWRANKIKTGSSLKIKVYFTARNNIKEPHFGVAIFRKDGVYCYGPNTKFEGYYIPELKAGDGYFILDYHKLFLAPGEYRISIAIWDKNETIAFVYQHSCYQLNIEGNHNARNQLLNMPFICFPKKFIIKNLPHPDLNTLKDKGDCKINSEDIEIQSVKLFDHHEEESSILTTNDSAKLTIDFSKLTSDKNYSLWVGLYREDGIYCQGIIQPLNRENSYTVLFSKLPLLPGGYEFSIGIWDDSKRRFIMYHYAIYPFRVVFNREDHGTIYLEHTWNWKLP